MSGYPASPSNSVAIALDAMVHVRGNVNDTYSLTVQMHVEAVADGMLSACLQFYLEKVVFVDIHFSSPSLVPLAKSSEQSSRDILAVVATLTGTMA